MDFDLQFFIMDVFAFLVAITVHEFGHAIAAVRLGDDTPRVQGRISLNPLDHVDLPGSLVFLVSTLLGAGFGWGRPVLVNPARFRHIHRDSVIVSFAGPAMNLLLAVILAATIRFHLFKLGYTSVYYQLICTGIVINVRLFLFNLIPLPPLDGSKILAGILPSNLAIPYERMMGQWGLCLFFVLFFFGARYLGPMVENITAFLSNTEPISTVLLSARYSL